MALCLGLLVALVSRAAAESRTATFPPRDAADNRRTDEAALASLRERLATTSAMH